MGNIFSLQNLNEDDNSSEFLERIDEYIASLIVSMDFQSLYQLSEEKFCKEMQELTRNIICDQIQGINLIFLYKRIKFGFSPQIEDDIQLFNNERKQEMCDEIAKFYVSLANVYAAIINILKPLLKGEQQTDVCQHVLSTIADAEQHKHMMELQQLYFDKFNPETDSFDGFSEQGEKMYREDLTSFYGGFSSSKDLPSSIQKFSDISLDEMAIPKRKHKATTTTTTRPKEVFEQLGQHIYQTVSKSVERTEKLKQILDALFVPLPENKTLVHPELTQTSLQKLLFKTRKLIVDLYANCERDQKETQRLLKLIAREKLEKTLENQVQFLEDKLKNFVF
jgi:hypothetical protein